MKIKILLFFMLLPGIVLAAVTTQSQQQAMTPEQALQQLEKGNQRFLQGNLAAYDYSKITAKTATAQHPIAVVLSCLDSRSSPDILFDQGIGNIYVARVAGNVVDKKILGSMEFGTKVTGAKLIVVMGHTNCGAMRGACNNVQLGNLTYVLQAIQPAVSQVKQAEQSQFNCDKASTIDAIAKENVLDQMQRIVDESPVIAKMVQEKQIMIVGAMQDLATGKVTFFDGNGKAL